MSRELEQEADDLVSKSVTGLLSLGFPIHTNNQIPGATFRSSLDVDPKVTPMITTSCKARAISVTTAVHAALILVTQSLAPALSSRKYTS